MSMKVRYPNGFEGVASDKVAEILEKKGAAKIIGEAKPVSRASRENEADQKKLADIKERLAKEKAAEHPNENAIRGLEAAIAKIEK